MIKKKKSRLSKNEKKKIKDVGHKELENEDEEITDVGEQRANSYQSSLMMRHRNRGKEKLKQTKKKVTFKSFLL